MSSGSSQQYGSQQPASASYADQHSSHSAHSSSSFNSNKSDTSVPDPSSYMPHRSSPSASTVPPPMPFDLYSSFSNPNTSSDATLANSYPADWQKYANPPSNTFQREGGHEGGSRGGGNSNDQALPFPSNLLSGNDQASGMLPMPSGLQSLTDPFFYQTMRFSPSLWEAAQNNNLGGINSSNAQNSQMSNQQPYSFDPSMSLNSYSGMPPNDNNSQPRGYSDRPGLSTSGYYDPSQNQGSVYPHQSNPYAGQGYQSHAGGLQPFNMHPYGAGNIQTGETLPQPSYGSASDHQTSHYYQPPPQSAATGAMSDIQPSALSADISDSVSATSGSTASTSRSGARGHKRSRNPDSTSRPHSASSDHSGGQQEAMGNLNPPGSSSSTSSSFGGSQSNLYTSPYNNLASLSKLQIDTTNPLPSASDPAAFPYDPLSSIPVTAGSSAPSSAYQSAHGHGAADPTSGTDNGESSNGDGTNGSSSGGSRKLYECKTCGRSE